MLEHVTNILDRAKRLNEQEAFERSIDSEIKQLIIDLNTKEQLGELGIDADSNILGEYAPFTVEERLRAGLQVNHVDFKVTGDYWRSWEVKVVGDEIQISVDQFRYDELVEDLRFSKTHVGLTDKNKAVLAEEMIFKYREFVIQNLFGFG